LDYDIVLHPTAEKEYLESCNWYEEQLPGLGGRFKAAISIQINKIRNNPESYPIKTRRFRESVVSAFPYLIVFTLNKEKSIIYISAIYHTSRNPKRKYRSFE